MTRQDIECAYKLDAQGRIQSPGKFELEMLYVPWFWELYLNGGADRDDGTVIGFDLTPQDKIEFPELKGKRTVKLLQTDSGFVIEC